MLDSKGRPIKGEEWSAKAQGLLQKALTYDPSNWMARYNNALFLQMTENYKSAPENWTFMLTELTRGHADRRTHDKGKTALLAKVNHNSALTLARVGDWNELKHAVTILEELIASDAQDLKWLAKIALAPRSARYIGRSFRASGRRRRRS